MVRYPNPALVHRSGPWYRVGGVVVAGVGFGVTRLFVAEAVQVDTTLAFLFAGILPLLLGLGVTAYGVALAVGASSRQYVLTVTRWCLLGTAAMAAVLVVTSFSTVLAQGTVRLFSSSPLLAANVLLAGIVGGVGMGHRSARAARQRGHIRRQANRTLLLDRLLRHEVINAVTIIRGNAQFISEGERRANAAEVIERAADRIGTTIEDVGTLIDEPKGAREVDIAAILTAELAEIRSAFPEMDVDYDGPAEGVDVAADERLGIVLGELLENAAEQPETDRVAVALSVVGYEVRLTVADDGPGLPERQRQLLESGVFPEYDDPSSGFGLQIVRLLVHEYDGDVTVTDGPNGQGAAIRLSLPRVDVDGGLQAAVGVSSSNLLWATISGVLAGLVMAGFWLGTSNVLPVIGSLYGVQNVGMGLVTHLFHSVVFAFIFAAAVAYPGLAGYADGVLRSGFVGIVWGTVLWLVAAGVVMPIWLQGLGAMTSIPNLPPMGFVAHAIWGSVLGVAYVTVYDRPVPSLR